MDYDVFVIILHHYYSYSIISISTVRIYPRAGLVLLIKWWSSGDLQLRSLQSSCGLSIVLFTDDQCVLLDSFLVSRALIYQEMASITDTQEQEHEHTHISLRAPF